MPAKVKINLENGQSYVIADMSTWVDLSYAINSMAEQWPKDAEEYSLWIKFLDLFESQYLGNLFEEPYEDDGWS